MWCDEITMLFERDLAGVSLDLKSLIRRVSDDHDDDYSHYDNDNDDCSHYDNDDDDDDDNDVTVLNEYFHHQYQQQPTL